jgi:hypothetical protein
LSFKTLCAVISAGDKVFESSIKSHNFESSSDQIGASIETIS